MTPLAEMTREFDAVTRCRIELPSGRIVVQGSEGDVASLRVRRLREDDPAASIVEGLVAIAHQDGLLSIRPGGRSGPWALGGLVAGRRSDLSIELTLPAEAGLAIDTTAADVRVQGCGGGQSVRSVAGDVRVDDAVGRVEVRAVSGSVTVRGASMDVEVSTTSGRISLEAGRAGPLRLRSVSGAIDVVGDVAADHGSRIESLSGDVSVATSDGITLVPHTVSGRVVADEGARREVRQGGAVLIVGDGRVEVPVRSVSGDIRLSGRPTTQALPRPAAMLDPAGGDALLEALEALARGDISIEEADRRLEVLHG
jgi:hypothetical protein